MTTDQFASDALLKLEGVLQEIFGESFEDEVRAQTENEKWYRSSLPVDELFRLWVRSRILDGDEPGWVFRGLRMADRRRLFQLLGLNGDRIANTTPAQHAELVLEAVGLPVKRTWGHRGLEEDWREVSQLIAGGEDERAATLGRQRAERFLRKLLYFYCSSGHGTTFITMLKDAGSLRVPKPFQTADVGSLPKLFVDDDVADLGFLALALRKFASRVEEQGLVSLSGTPLLIFNQKEHEAFSALGTALQPYTHDKPSKFAVRQQEFSAAASTVTGFVNAMAARNVVPDDAYVVETCESLVGQVFRATTDDGTHVHLVAQQSPPIGTRVLYIASARCKYATCVWAPNPWT